MLQDLTADFMNEILLCVVQTLVQLLKTQGDDGFWGPYNPRQETVYCSIALCHLSRLPLAIGFREEIQASLRKGHQAVTDTDKMSERRKDPLWIEKVTYEAGFIIKAYELAALRSTSEESPETLKRGVKNHLDTKIGSSDRRSSEKLSEFAELFKQTSIFDEVPRWILNIFAVEARLLLPRLEEYRSKMFQRRSMNKDKYLTFIPFIWAACNNIDGAFMPSELLFDMMVISVLDFQVDEIMEVEVDARKIMILKASRGKKAVCARQQAQFERRNQVIGTKLARPKSDSCGKRSGRAHKLSGGH